MHDELKHYGVAGMHWGIRRYQNEDGSLTPAGRVHYGVGIKEYSRNADKANDIYKTLSKKEKYYLTGNAYKGKLNFDKEYEKQVDYDSAVYSLILEMQDVPVSVFDVYGNGDKGYIAVAVHNDKQYRGAGLAKESTKRALDWFENNPDIMELNWATFAGNRASQKLAEEMGFELNKKDSDDKVFIYSKRK